MSKTAMFSTYNYIAFRYVPVKQYRYNVARANIFFMFYPSMLIAHYLLNVESKMFIIFTKLIANSSKSSGIIN